jgi:DNA-binding response OmpR family regulator
MSSPMNVAPNAPSHVAALFVSRWAETAVGGALEGEGMRMRKFGSAAELVAALHTADIDVAIIEDRGTHLAACMAALRFRGTTNVPIIAVGNGSADEIASALRLGACDYAVIGEASQTLVNRVRARVEVCRQPEQRVSQQVGPCTLDAQSRTLRFRGGELQLTWREFALAWVLFESSGQVVHLHTISRQVWGTDVSVAKRTIEQHVCRLRRKLLLACESSDQLLVLHAVTNVGYRMVAEVRATGRVRSALPAKVLASEFSVTGVKP